LFLIEHFQPKRRLDMPETEAKKPPRERDYTWFVSPGDAHTNEVISRRLPEENFSLCTLEGEIAEIGLWQCPAQFVTFLRLSKKSAHLNFRIFNREGDGKIRECSFMLKSQKAQKISGR
jgi:hypothetical protein